MEDREDNLIQLSSLQHYMFCKRQCYLIHAEQTWEDNIFTAEGKIMHQNADQQKEEYRGNNLKIEYALLIRSLKLGITGKADVVEFHKESNGIWRPFPVEYKRGKPKENRCDEIQLCAQALCLEEMLNIDVPEGALFYGKTKHRHNVSFDKILRSLTEETCLRVHELLEQATPPPAVYVRELCEACSIKNLCLPKISGKSVSFYLSSLSSPSSKSSIFSPSSNKGSPL